MICFAILWASNIRFQIIDFKMISLIVLSVCLGLSSATYRGVQHGGFPSAYVQTLPPRVTSLTMTFPLGNPFRPGENFVDLGRTGPYYLGNGYRGYMMYPTYGISNTYNRLFGGGYPFSGLTGGHLGGGLIGGNFGHRGGLYGSYPTWLLG